MERDRPVRAHAGRCKCHRRRLAHTHTHAGPRAATGVHRPPPQHLFFRGPIHFYKKKEGHIPKHLTENTGGPVKVTVVLSVWKKKKQQQQVPVRKKKKMWHPCQIDRTSVISSNNRESLNARHLKPTDATHQGENLATSKDLVVVCCGLRYLLSFPFLLPENKTNIPRRHPH